MIDCEMSITLLSEFRDGSLDEPRRTEVIIHIKNCPPCLGLFRDLDLIVVSATELRARPAIDFPDEETVWRRIRIEKRTSL